MAMNMTIALIRYGSISSGLFSLRWLALSLRGDTFPGITVTVHLISNSPPIIRGFPYIPTQSATHRAALVLPSQFEELGFDLREQAGWNEAIAEHAWLSRNR